MFWLLPSWRRAPQALPSSSRRKPAYSELRARKLTTTPNQFERDREAYRMAHGSGALYPYYDRSTGKLYVVKSQTADAVVLAEVFGHREREVTPATLSSSFGMWFQDETVFWFGSNDQQAAAHTQWNRV